MIAISALAFQKMMLAINGHQSASGRFGYDNDKLIITKIIIFTMGKELQMAKTSNKV